MRFRGLSLCLSRGRSGNCFWAASPFGRLLPNPVLVGPVRLSENTFFWEFSLPLARLQEFLSGDLLRFLETKMSIFQLLLFGGVIGDRIGSALDPILLSK